MPSRRRRGFTLVELLLVTVVLGLLASILAPYLGRARERACLAQMQTDVRRLMEGVENFQSLHNGAFPTSLSELEAGSTYVRTTDVEICLFVAVPRSVWREPYVIAQAGHRATSIKVFIVYPLWGSRMIDYESGRPGC